MLQTSQKKTEWHICNYEGSLKKSRLGLEQEPITYVIAPWVILQSCSTTWVIEPSGRWSNASEFWKGRAWKLQDHKGNGGRDWKKSFPCGLQACEVVKNLTSNKLLRALNFDCKKMKKLKFWISTLTRDWHLLKHQLFYLSTMEIESLSTCLKPHFYVSLLHWHGTLVCSGTEPFVCEFLGDIFCTEINVLKKCQGPVWTISHPTILRQKMWSLC